MNFHDLSLKLEVKAREVLGYKSRPYGKIFDADSIECGRFAEVLIMLLRIKSNYMCNNLIDVFIEKTKPYLNQPQGALDLCKAHELYNEFLKILSSL